MASSAAPAFFSVSPGFNSASAAASVWATASTSSVVEASLFICASASIYEANYASTVAVSILGSVTGYFSVHECVWARLAVFWLFKSSSSSVIAWLHVAVRRAAQAAFLTRLRTLLLMLLPFFIIIIL